MIFIPIPVIHSRLINTTPYTHNHPFLKVSSLYRLQSDFLAIGVKLKRVRALLRNFIDSLRADQVLIFLDMCTQGAWMDAG